MAYVRATFCLNPATLKRLHGFARRSGLNKSALINDIVSCGLDRLESDWRSAGDILKRPSSKTAKARNGARRLNRSPILYKAQRS